MEFYLHYRGPLKGNGKPKDKQHIRRHIHKQLRELWNQKTLGEFKPWLSRDNSHAHIFLRDSIPPFTFVPLVNESMDLIAELDITLLRPEPPGSIITQAGDIDNRLKTLFDALRKPHNVNELPEGDVPKSDEDLFFCLLEDDNLIQHAAIRTDRLLEPINDPLEVVLLIKVLIKVTRATMENLSFGV